MKTQTVIHPRRQKLWPMPLYRVIALCLVMAGGAGELYGLGATFPSRQQAWTVAFSGLVLQIAGMTVSLKYRRRNG